MALYHNLTDLLVKTDFTAGIPYADAWINPSGKIIAGKSFNHRKIAENILMQYDLKRNDDLYIMEHKIREMKMFGMPDNDLLAVYDSLRNKKSCKELFDIYHKRHNLDECEFLIAMFGYVAVEDKHIIYNPKMVNSFQTCTLGVYYDICDNNTRKLII